CAEVWTARRFAIVLVVQRLSRLQLRLGSVREDLLQRERGKKEKKRKCLPPNFYFFLFLKLGPGVRPPPPVDRGGGVEDSRRPSIQLKFPNQRLLAWRPAWRDRRHARDTDDTLSPPPRHRCGTCHPQN